MDHLCFFLSCVSHAFTSVHCCLVVTCWERAILRTLVGDVYCIFVTFPCGILGQVWYLFVSFPDLCRLNYFDLDRNCLIFCWHSLKIFFKKLILKKHQQTTKKDAKLSSLQRIKQSHMKVTLLTCT